MQQQPDQAQQAKREGGDAGHINAASVAITRLMGDPRQHDGDEEAHGEVNENHPAPTDQVRHQSATARPKRHGSTCYRSGEREGFDPLLLLVVVI